MKRFGICLLVVLFGVMLAVSVFAATGQGGVVRPQLLPPGVSVPKLLGHVSVYPFSNWGVYLTDGTTDENYTMRADYNIALDLAYPIEKGALGLSLYRMKGNDLTETGYSVAYYAPSFWGFSAGVRQFDYPDAESDTGPVFEALLFPKTEAGKPALTLGLGMSRPVDKWLPSLSVNASIPWKDRMSFDVSLWGMRDQFDFGGGYSIEEWVYRVSAGIGYSF